MKKLIFIAMLVAMVAPAMAYEGAMGPYTPALGGEGIVPVTMIVVETIKIETPPSIVLTDVGGGYWEGDAVCTLAANFDARFKAVIVEVAPIPATDVFCGWDGFTYVNGPGGATIDLLWIVTTGNDVTPSLYARVLNTGGNLNILLQAGAITTLGNITITVTVL